MDCNIIGIVGPFASGKGVVTEYLMKNFGYISFSLSAIVHDEVKRKGIVDYDRTVLQNTGDELRKKEGDGVLAKRAIKKLQSQKNKLHKVVIEGIRNPGEIAYLRSIPGFTLIAVNASQKIRFQRMLLRKKPWDPKDWETFKRMDERDGKDTKNTNGQQVQKCMEMADIHLQNNASKNEFYEDIKKALSSRLPLHTGR